MKYMIKPLESHCINYLLENLNAENVFTVIQFCVNCATDKQLMDECKEFIRTKTEAVLKADSFTEISRACLTLLLRQNSLNVAECALFEAVCFSFLLKLNLKYGTIPIFILSVDESVTIIYNNITC